MKASAIALITTMSLSFSIIPATSASAVVVKSKDNKQSVLTAKNLVLECEEKVKKSIPKVWKVSCIYNKSGIVVDKNKKKINVGTLTFYKNRSDTINKIKNKHNKSPV